MILKKIANPIIHFWAIDLVRKWFKLAYRQYVIYPLKQKEFSKLKSYKNKHLGQRCFIIATGPSLTIDDVNKVKGEITIGMNSAFKLFDKTDWRPSYYFIEDQSVYNRCEGEIKQYNFNDVFVADYIKWYDVNVHHLPVISSWAGTAIERKYTPRYFQKNGFSTDITKKCYYGTSVMHFILQTCFYMGFKEVYLLGTDCDFSASIKHSRLVSYKGSDKMANSPQDMYNGLMNDYALAKKESEKGKTIIYNASRGGKLEMFQRVNLDDIV